MAPHDRYCDLVMKGGITSGVVYPSAIARLAETYRFRSIGGTSAGAIAAVCTAAAEYRRRHGDGDMAGFAGLAALSEEISRPGKLLSLFQPVYGCRRLFTVLQTALNARNKWTRAASIVGGLALGYFVASGVALAAALLTGWLTGSVFAGVLMFGVAWLVGVAGAVLYNVSTAVVDADYGLCSGMPERARLGVRMKRWLKREPAPEALMPWLHAKVQSFAGLPLDEPLTFGHLWRPEPHFPPKWSGLPEGTRPIELQMFTTCLSHGRPYVLPFEGEAQALHYRRDDLARIVPPEVMAWLDRVHAQRVHDGWTPPADAPEGIRPLPAPRDFPVLLAARMSLSFPLLFGAVPLYVADDTPWPADGAPKPRPLRRCLFSDGGIASNFPVHLFDGLLPMWPTFGLQLEPLPDHVDPATANAQLVRLPTRYDEGDEERWDRFDDPKRGGFSRFAGFLFAIVGTMQNWNDNALARMPGVRDRVARVGLFGNEGGLNLDMPPETVRRITARGDAAVDTLLAHYGPQPDGTPYGRGWDEQRWVRLGVLLTLMRKRFGGLRYALNGANPHATPYATLLRRAQARDAAAPTIGDVLGPGGATSPLLAGLQEGLSAEQVQQLERLLDALARQDAYSSLVGTDPARPFHARPEPDLRIRPSL